MSDVLDIISKLSLQVEGVEGLDKVITKLQRQAEGIEALKKRLQSLNQDYQRLGEQGAAKSQEVVQNQINKTTDAIKKQSEVLQQNFLSNKKLQEALRDELGLMEVLSQFITRHTAERATLTDISQIRKYTDEIKSAQTELKSLLAVSNEPLRQGGAIEALELRRTQIQNAIKTAPSASNPNGVIQYTKGTEKEYIASLNKELAKTEMQLKELRNAGKEPIINPIRQVGAIEALENRLLILRNTLKTLPAGNISEVNRQIQLTERQLGELRNQGKELQSGGSGQSGGAASLLFNGNSGSLGRQLLTGSLIGLGIGGGFGLITRAVSALIEGLKSLSDEYLHASEYADKLKDEMDSTSSSVSKQITVFVELAKAIDDAFGAGDIAAQAQLNTTKALGIVNGEIFKAQEQQFKDEQVLRRQQLVTLDQIGQKYQDVQNIFRGYDKGGDLNGVHDKINSLFGIGSEDARRFNEIVDKYLDARRKLNGDEQKKFLLSDNEDLLKLIAANSSAGNQKQEEINNADKERISKHNEAVFELDKQLKESLRQANEKYEQDRIKSLVTTAETIKLAIKDETNFRIAEIERRRKDERLKLSGDENTPITPYNYIDANGKKRTADPEKDFNNEEGNVRKDQRLKELEQLRAYYHQQLQEQTKFNQEFLANELASNKQKVSEVSPISTGESLELRRKINDDELKLQLSKNSAEYSAEIDQKERLQAERRDRHEQETEDYKVTAIELSSLYKEFAETETDIIRGNNIKKLNEYAEYYASLIKLINEHQAVYLNAISLAQGLRDQQILGGNGFHFLSEKDRLKVSHLQGDIDRNQTTINDDNNSKLPAANKRLSSADDNLTKAQQSGTAAEISAAAQEVDKAKAEVERLEAEVTNAGNKITEDSKEITKTYVESAISYFQQMSESAVKAYDTISNARQKDLEREISVRTQRVDMAYKLAERGNTQALAQEQKALDAAQRQKRQAALQEQEVNAALTVSNSILAVVKAAAEGGIFAPATIAAMVALLATGIAEATALGEAQKSQFYTGGYTGDGGKYAPAGTVHRGEFVFDQEKTARYRPLFEAIHKGFEPLPMPGLPKWNQSVVNNNFASRQDFSELKESVDNVTEAVEGQKINVGLDQRGFYLHQRQVQRAQRNRWRN